jgi:tetratricopeptide (TPR) repeat protein
LDIDTYLRDWNCTALLLKQRLEVRGLHENPLLERVNENALGGIYLTIGDLDEAGTAFGRALDLVEPDTDPRDLAALHANLGPLELR